MAKRYSPEQAHGDAKQAIDQFMGRGKTPQCRCRNHLGKPKTQHKSKDAALKAVMRRHVRHGGPFITYPCPTRPGVFHVATDRKKNP